MPDIDEIEQGNNTKEENLHEKYIFRLVCITGVGDSHTSLDNKLISIRYPIPMLQGMIMSCFLRILHDKEFLVNLCGFASLHIKVNRSTHSNSALINYIKSLSFYFR